MKKKCAAMLLAFSLLLTSCAGKSADEEIKLPIYGADEISFEIAEAKYMDISETTALGVTVGYPYSVYLTYPAEASVTFFDITNGDIVTEGQILAQLDSSDLDYEINNQKTALNAAYNASLSGGTAAALQYQIEQSRLDMLLAEKEAYTIRAPFDGIVTSVTRATEGAIVAAGDLCCAISEENRACIYVEGGEAANFRFGQQVQVKLDNVTYDATVVEAPDIAPATATSVNVAMFDLGDGVMEKIWEENSMAISAGWATVYVTESRKNVLAVPDAAIKSVGTDHYVTMVDGDERFRLNVTIGKQLGGYTEILNGISEGDIVMAQGSGVFSSANENEEEPGDWNWELKLSSRLGKLSFRVSTRCRLFRIRRAQSARRTQWLSKGSRRTTKSA